MGRVIGSNTGAGVVRGQPVPAGRDGAAGGRSRISGLVGVTCLEFDAVGALLAAGGPDSVSVYDFDEFLPKVFRLRLSSSLYLSFALWDVPVIYQAAGIHRLHRSIAQI